jgi:hypothetical protein
MKGWKVCACVAYTKRHEEVLEQAKRSNDCCFCYVLWCHWNLMVTFDQGNTGKNLQPCSLLDRSRMLVKGKQLWQAARFRHLMTPQGHLYSSLLRNMCNKDDQEESEQDARRLQLPELRLRCAKLILAQLPGLAASYSVLMAATKQLALLLLAIQLILP